MFMFVPARGTQFWDARATQFQVGSLGQGAQDQPLVAIRACDRPSTMSWDSYGPVRRAGAPCMAFAVPRLAWQTRAPPPWPPGAARSRAPPHGRYIACTTGLPRRAACGGPPCGDAAANRWPSFLHSLPRLRPPRSIFSRPSAAHIYLTPMAALCDVRGRGMGPGGCAKGVQSLSEAHFSVPTRPRCTHSVTDRLKTTLESLGT
jgi:hypothetical protein